VGWRQGWATGGPLYTAPDGSAAPLAWLRSGEPIAVHRSGPDSAAPGWERVQLTGPHYALQGYLPQSRLPPRPAQRARPVSHAASGGFGWAGPMVRPVVHEVPAQARLYDAPGGAVVGFVPAETTLRQGEGSQRGWVSLTVWLPGWGAVPVWAPADTLGTTYDPFVASLPTRTSLYAEGDCARSVLDKRRGTLSRRTGADEAGVHIVYAGAGWFNLSSAYQRTHHPDGSESLSALGEAWTELLELRPDGSFVLGGQVWHRSRAGCLAASERP